MARIEVSKLVIETQEDGQAHLVCETSEGDYRLIPRTKVVGAMDVEFTKVDRQEEAKEQPKEEEVKE